MNAEQLIRETLQREAERHPINPHLGHSTLTKARLSRFFGVVGIGVVAASVLFGGLGLENYLDRSKTPVTPGSGGATSSTGETTEGPPHLLVTEDGWRVTHANEDSGKYGMVDFSADRKHYLSLGWRPTDQHGGSVQDRERAAEASWDITIAGRQAILFQLQDTTTDFTALWLDGNHSMELSGTFPNVDEYRAVAATLQPVDTDTWLAAMPESVVVPNDRAATVEAMLADIPVHPSVDVEKLKTSRLVNGRYELGVDVTGAVSCAWIEQWVDATAKGDDESAQEAAGAMATSHTWAILAEMNELGGWTELVWEYADAMAENRQVMDGTIEESWEWADVMVDNGLIAENGQIIGGGGPFSIEESYRSAFGCDAGQ